MAVPNDRLCWCKQQRMNRVAVLLLKETLYEKYRPDVFELEDLDLEDYCPTHVEEVLRYKRKKWQAELDAYDIDVDTGRDLLWQRYGDD